MIIKIPSDALVVMMGPAGSGKSTFAAANFTKSEIVSSDDLRHEITGDATDQSANEDVFARFHACISERLKASKLTVADATNVTGHARKRLYDIAAKYTKPVVILMMTTTPEQCLQRNANRTRKVPEDVILKHCRQFEVAKYNVWMEPAASRFFVSWPQTEIVLDTPIIKGAGFDVIGDIHGTFNELQHLLDLLGYVRRVHDWTITGFNELAPERKLVFVGDITDRGPDNVSALNLLQSLVEKGFAHVVMGNHDNKLLRWLKGNNVKVSHGLQVTVDELLSETTPDERQGYAGFLEALPTQLILEPTVGQPLVVTHAGIPRQHLGRMNKKTKEMTRYGVVAGFEEDGMPMRDLSWVDSWKYSQYSQVFGHIVHKEPTWYSSQVCCIDTGAVFGGKLTALRWPEKEFVSVVSKEYSESKQKQWL